MPETPKPDYETYAERYAFWVGFAAGAEWLVARLNEYYNREDGDE
jgi:hypothetical protein